MLLQPCAAFARCHPLPLFAEGATLFGAHIAGTDEKRAGAGAGALFGAHAFPALQTAPCIAALLGVQGFPTLRVFEYALAQCGFSVPTCAQRGEKPATSENRGVLPAPHDQQSGRLQDARAYRLTRSQLRAFARERADAGPIARLHRIGRHHPRTTDADHIR